jgi:hypothetical protein
MRLATITRALPVTVFLMIGFQACGLDPTATDDPASVPSFDASPQVEGPYESCPYAPADLAARTCATYHPGSVVNTFCFGGTCFEMNFGGEARLVAADELGAFPTTFFAWHQGVIAPPAGLIPCLFMERGNKTRINIPAQRLCAVSLTTDQHLYYWHFASNPISGCLGWVECRQY